MDGTVQWARYPSEDTVRYEIGGPGEERTTRDEWWSSDNCQMRMPWMVVNIHAWAIIPLIHSNTTEGPGSRLNDTGGTEST